MGPLLSSWPLSRAPALRLVQVSAPRWMPRRAADGARSFQQPEGPQRSRPLLQRKPVALGALEKFRVTLVYAHADAPLLQSECEREPTEATAHDCHRHVLIDSTSRLVARRTCGR